jgi:cytidylate kinase
MMGRIEMAVITISRGSYSRGKEIAEKVSRELGYDCISREVILQASREFNTPEIKLIHALENAPSFLDRFTYGKRRYIAYTQTALLKHLTRDNIVYHGLAGHYFVGGISHVLKVLVTAPAEARAQLVMERDKVGRKEAFRLIREVDAQRRKWGRRLYGIDPWDPTLYDLALHIDRVTVEDAVDMICRLISLKRFETTMESQGRLEDLALAAQVNSLLIDIKPSVDVWIENRFVYLKTQAPLPRDSELVNWTGEIARKIPNVKGIRIVTAEELEGGYVCVSNPERRPARDRTPTFFTEL